MSEWIPVTERLPDYSGRFLVVLEVIEDVFAMGIKTIDIARRCSDSTWEMSGVSIKCKVTHWMPLPEPPEGGADG